MNCNSTLYTTENSSSKYKHSKKIVWRKLIKKERNTILTLISGGTSGQHKSAKFHLFTSTVTSKSRTENITYATVYLFANQRKEW